MKPVDFEQLELRANALADKVDRPDHEWRGTKVRFEKAPGEWGDFVECEGLDRDAVAALIDPLIRLYYVNQRLPSEVDDDANRTT